MKTLCHILLWLVLCAPLSLLSDSGAAYAQSGTVINFDDIGGEVPITEQYASLGVHFTGASTLTEGVSLNPTYPPRSGNQLIYDSTTGVIEATFDHGQLVVGGFITGRQAITMYAYDASGKLVGTDSTPGANYTGASAGLSPNIMLQVKSTGSDIVRVDFHDDGNSFTIDDFFFDAAGITIDPTLPGSVGYILPSVRPRSGYALTTSIVEYQKVVTVKDNHGNPLAGVTVHLSITGNNVPAGHLANHGLGSVHGWLFDPAMTTDYTDDAGNTIDLDTTVARTALGGSTEDTSLDELVTDKNGQVTFVYIPAEVSGIDTLKAEVTGLTPITRDIAVKVPGLTRLYGPPPGHNGVADYTEIGAGDESHYRFAVSPVTASLLQNAAEKYIDLQQQDPEYLGYLTQLAKLGIVMPTVGLQINDCSLPWGGLFDIDNDFSPPHGGHREGNHIDVRVTDLVYKSDLPLSGGRNYLGATGSTTLIKHAHYRQFQLLYQALSAFSIPSGIIVVEGAQKDHFHVKFTR